MVESQIINEREVWIKVDPHPIARENSNIIPTEYFTAVYYLQDPADEDSIGVLIKDEEGAVKLFESPVEAIGYARKRLDVGV